MTSPAPDRLVPGRLDTISRRIAALSDQMHAVMQRSVRRARRAPVGFVVSAIVVLVALILPGFVLINLDRGFELSDTGYYYVSIFHSDEIAMQTTQFAIVWQLLGLPDNIYLHRLAVFALLMGAGASLALSLTRYLQGPNRPGLISRPAYAAFGAGAFSLFYFFWLTDPSYNAIGLALNGFVMALFFRVARLISEESCVSIATCVMAGVIGMALVYVRPPTAAFLAVAGALLILTAGGWRPQHFMRIALAAIGGALAFVVVVSVLVEPVWETLARIEGGFDRREILARGGSFERSVSQYFSTILNELNRGFYPPAYWPLITGSFLGLLVATSRLEDTRNSVIWWMQAGMVVFGFVSPTFLWGIETWSVGRDGWMLLGTTLVKVLLVAASAAITFELVVHLRPRFFPKFAALHPPASASLAVIVLIIAFGAQFIGTSNAWFHFSVVAFGLVMMMVLVPLSLTRGWIAPPMSVSALIMLGSSQFLVMHVANGSPYLLARPLAEQTIPTSVGPDGSVLKLDPEGHQLVTELQRAGAPISQGEGPPPVLLDMTGTVPGATYLLGARAPGVPWLNWSLPGSQQMFDNAVAGLSDDDFANAWVLYSPDWHRSLEADALAARGRQVPDDYVEMGRAHLALRDIDILILAPRETAEADPTP